MQNSKLKVYFHDLGGNIEIESCLVGWLHKVQGCKLN